MKDMYEMELNDEFEIPKTDTYIMRVPGGWIYMYLPSGEDDRGPTSVFVPYNDEFKKRVPSPPLKGQGYTKP